MRGFWKRTEWKLVAVFASAIAVADGAALAQEAAPGSLVDTILAGAELDPNCTDVARPISPELEQPFQQPAEQPFALPAPQNTLASASSFAAAPPGYIDWAVPRTSFRLRYDAGFDNNFPDRAEFFYAQCGCFGNGAPGPGNPPVAGANGTTNTSVDFQDIGAYFEYATSNRFSAFVEVPIRFIDTRLSPNAPGAIVSDTGDTGGLGDMNVGFKYAIQATNDQYLTFQLRTYIPTGNASHGLGTDHVSLEPALLFTRALDSKATVYAELRDWIPIDGVSGFQGNVLRYGVGLGYDVGSWEDMSIMPLVEIVGWSVLDGKKFNVVEGGLLDADNDSIVNLKIGVRIGDNIGLAGEGRSLFVGYGHALTDDQWYQDIWRVDYTVAF